MGPSYAVSCMMEKNIFGRQTPLFGNGILRCFFPLLGSVWENEYRHEGVSYALTQHGFARDMDFELMLELEDEVRYRLVDSEETRKKYPFPFCLEIGYRIEGKKIEVLWKVINTGTREIALPDRGPSGFLLPGL